MESERLIIGVMMNCERSSVHLALMSLLSSEDFFVEQHQAVWRIIGSMREAGIDADPIAVADNANARKEFIGGAQYIVDAVKDPVSRMCSDEAVEAAAARVKGFSLSRKLMRALTMASVLGSSGQPFDQVASYVEDEIANLKRLATSSRSGPKQATFYYDAVLARVIAKQDGEVVAKGVSTGFPELDEILGNLPPEGLVVIAGRPGMGKTAFASAVEQNISNAGVPTLMFSLEMPGIALAQRNIARHARILYRNVRNADIADHEFAALIDTLHVLGNAPCYIDDTPGLSMAEIRARSRAFKEKFPNCVILLDYLQIVQAGADKKSKDPRYVVSDTSMSLVQMARELKCPVIALSQLSRDLMTRANKRPVMSDLRESGQIEQDASVIIFLYRDEEYNPDSAHKGTTEAIIAKNREGETKTVRFASDLSIMHYSEMGSFNTDEV